MTSQESELGFSPDQFRTDVPVLTECLEGPYYIEVPECKDTRSGEPDAVGVPMNLGLCIVNGDTGKPHPGAIVDIWNCNAHGIYSGFEDVDPDRPPNNPGDMQPRTPGRWLRGRQTADDNGLVEYLTVYPSWYSTRVPHVHLKVWIDGVYVLTSQLYLPDEETHELLKSGDYLRDVEPDADMDSDFVRFMMGYDGGAMIAVEKVEDGYVGRATVAFDPSARSEFQQMSREIWETIPTSVGTWRAKVPGIADHYADMKRRGK
jgi:protocatechuate 3,4-dioxygenase beta subunit